MNCRVLQKGKCEITQGCNSNHIANDIVGGGYTLDYIVAHTEGTVVECRTNCTGFESGGSYGNYVKIKHPNGYFTLYAHMSYGTIQVKSGSKVSKGQVLGYMGSTGTSYGGHLHFEVRTPNNQRIDPSGYLNADLPSIEVDHTGTITYQAYAEGWLREVNKCDNTDNGYAGVYGIPISGVRCKPQYGEIIYEVHTKGGSWIGAVNSKNYSKNNGDSFAGYLGKPIDGFRAKSTKGYVEYRVHTLEDGWLEWAKGFGDSGNEYAGVYGHTIDGIQMR